MRVLLLDIEGKSKKKCINKDLAGGMGTGTWVGNSFLARVFEYVIKKNVIIPDIAPAYLSAIFKKAGWQVELVHGTFDDVSVLPEADLALIPVTIVDYRHELQIVKKARAKNIHVGIYGTFASVMPDFFLEHADFVVKGEPEPAALKIASEKSLPRGIFEAGFVENLDEIPFPDWSQFPVKKYSYSPALNKKPVLVMLASRGCPHSCSYYCPYTINSGKKWRTRSIKNIIDEIKYLKKEYGVKAIDFRDPVFTLEKNCTREFSEALISENLDIIWSCETRLDALDKDLIRLMYRAGLRNLNVGIESFSEEVLKSVKRLPVEYRHQEEIIKYCKKIGVTVAAFYVFGFEEDTKKNIEETIKYAKKLNTLVARFGICTPYPGTDFFEELKKAGRITDFDWENYDEFTPVFKHKNLKKSQLLKLKEKAHVSYYFRPAYIMRYMPKYILQKFLWPF